MSEHKYISRLQELRRKYGVPDGPNGMMAHRAKQIREQMDAESNYWYCVKCEHLNRTGGAECWHCHASSDLGRVVMRADLDARIERIEKARRGADAAAMRLAQELAPVNRKLANALAENRGLRAEVAELRRQRDNLKQLLRRAKSLLQEAKSPDPKPKRPSAAEVKIGKIQWKSRDARAEALWRAKQRGLTWREVGKMFRLHPCTACTEGNRWNQYKDRAAGPGTGNGGPEGALGGRSHVQ